MQYNIIHNSQQQPLSISTTTTTPNTMQQQTQCEKDLLRFNYVC